MDPPMTSDPFFFPTGMDSPVMRLSSQRDSPDTTRPSTGTLAPGTTLRTSPRCSRSTSSRRSLDTAPVFLSSVTRMASVAFRDMSLDSASEVLA